MPCPVVRFQPGERKGLGRGRGAEEKNRAVSLILNLSLNSSSSFPSCERGQVS